MHRERYNWKKILFPYFETGNLWVRFSFSFYELLSQ
jgi:hypothetical protein